MRLIWILFKGYERTAALRDEQEDNYFAMMIKKITGTRSYMIIDFGDRKVKVQGELTSTPAFYGYINSITNWEPPYENEVISASEKSTIIDEVSRYDNPEFQISLDDW